MLVVPGESRASRFMRQSAWSVQASPESFSSAFQSSSTIEIHVGASINSAHTKFQEET